MRNVWTDEQVAIAAGMRRAKFGIKAIAKRLNVTENAVRTKLLKVGVRKELDGSNRGTHTQPPARILHGIMNVREDEE